MSQRSSSESISTLIDKLHGAELDLSASELADVLWLMLEKAKRGGDSALSADLDEPAADDESTIEVVDGGVSELITPSRLMAPAVPLALDRPGSSSTESSGSALPISLPAPSVLPQARQIARSLRPLMRRYKSRRFQVMDEAATVIRIVDEKNFSPVMVAALERWLELAIVAEETTIFEVWRETIAAFQGLMEHLGFRDVRAWQLIADGDGSKRDGPRLFRRRRSGIDLAQPRRPRELRDPEGRRLILFMSDGTSKGWRSGDVPRLLADWTVQNPVTLVQLLPGRLWERTTLGWGHAVWLGATEPGEMNGRLIVEGLPRRRDAEESGPAQMLTLPVVTLEPESLAFWARMVAGCGDPVVAGVVLDVAEVKMYGARMAQAAVEEELTAEELVGRFRGTASPIARRLAAMMAAVPVSWPVVRLIQRSMLPESTTVHVAEIFLSGLVRLLLLPEGETRKRYEFVPGVRELLIGAVPVRRTADVVEVVAQDIFDQFSAEVRDAISREMVDRFGSSLRRFKAFLVPGLIEGLSLDEGEKSKLISFGSIATSTLRMLGGEYAELVQALEMSSAPFVTAESVVVEVEPEVEFPPLKTLEFVTAQLVDESVVKRATLGLEQFEFVVATLVRKQTGRLRKRVTWEVQRQGATAWRWVERLVDELVLEMVSIPAGRFLMGSAEREIDRYSSEGPQHEVTVSEFWMGRYPVTQAQWRFVAELDPVKQELDADPSRFKDKGDTYPVERVSWLDATEFCARLTVHTGRLYRLSSEAEWEYACRAGTQTPFHFGETITTELATYRGTDNKEYKWSGSYGEGPKGKYREETTPVDEFGIANLFGLSDMHGNVWEWCEDHWNPNYEGAPTTGAPWLDLEASEDANRVLRGGSWFLSPRHCRSATRLNDDAGDRDYVFGFRVVCVVSRS
jgi:formylglycine-generating enzyme required for sulfatase activity